jgi:hypothetical protein
MLPIVTEPQLEAPTSNAEIRYRIQTPVPSMAPTERAELNLKIKDNLTGSVSVPGRFTKLLTDASTYGGGVAGMVWGPSTTIKAIESTNSTLPWWATLGIVAGQMIGIGWATTRALRRRR